MENFQEKNFTAEDLIKENVNLLNIIPTFFNDKQLTEYRRALKIKNLTETVLLKESSSSDEALFNLDKI